MIITESKPFEEVVESLRGSKRVLVLGCGRCATSCETGGEKQVDDMCERLRAEGFEAEAGMVEAQCDERLSKLALRGKSFDAVLAMSCGSGTQAIEALTGKAVVPSNNTLFLGVIKPGRRYEERCTLCGECLLAETGGICPVTRCSKGLLNGPCGGSADGKCEVGDGRDCAWAMINEKLRLLGKEEDIGKVHKARRNMARSRPRKVERE